VQQLFQEEIKSHGWYTADLRRAGEDVFPRNQQVADLLLADQVEMVRDWDGCCAKPRSMMPSELWHILMKIRGRASRLRLRTAGETLPVTMRKQVLLSKQSSATNQALRVQALIRSIPCHCLQ
jgi:hypothetical protein